MLEPGVNSRSAFRATSNTPTHYTHLGATIFLPSEFERRWQQNWPAQPCHRACRRPGVPQNPLHKHPWRPPPNQRTRKYLVGYFVSTQTWNQIHSKFIFTKIRKVYLLYHSMHWSLEIKGNCTISNLPHEWVWMGCCHNYFRLITSRRWVVLQFKYSPISQWTLIPESSPPRQCGEAPKVGKSPRVWEQFSVHGVLF